MTAADDLAKGWAHVAAGQDRRALRAGWRAADEALMRQDAATLEQVVVLAEQIAERSTRGTATEAERLASYCTNCLVAGGGTVRSQSILARIARIRKTTKACPDCLAQIPTEARACQHCGYRY